AEDQLENRRKVAEAQQLLAEAKKLREDAANAMTEDALAELEREAAAMGGEPGDIQPAGGGSLDDILTGRSGGHREKASEFNPFKAGRNQIVKATASMMTRPMWQSSMPQASFDSGLKVARAAMSEYGSAIVKREI